MTCCKTFTELQKAFDDISDMALQSSVEGGYVSTELHVSEGKKPKLYLNVEPYDDNGTVQILGDFVTLNFCPYCGTKFK